MPRLPNMAQGYMTFLPRDVAGIWTQGPLPNPRVRLSFWECCQCNRYHEILDKNCVWEFPAPEPCTIEPNGVPNPCQHIRCNNCYDCTTEKERIQYCNKDLYPRPDTSRPQDARALGSPLETETSNSPSCEPHMACMGSKYGYGAINPDTDIEHTKMRHSAAKVVVVVDEPEKPRPASLYGNPFDYLPGGTGEGQN